MAGGVKVGVKTGLEVFVMFHESFDYLAQQEWWNKNSPGRSMYSRRFNSVFPGSSTSSEMAPHLSSKDRGFFIRFLGPPCTFCLYSLRLAQENKCKVVFYYVKKIRDCFVFTSRGY